ncbi:GatB/YqeY domain-containing protein [Candidatus Peregrinibacteria bacterium]|nr:GatB/YqeY domain-containing protein [Candidatus Peregrinibacteria bacterium]
MTLKEQIVADMTAAMKSKDPSLSTLRMLKADIMKYEVSGANMVATDDVVLDLIKRAIKQRKEAAEGFTQGGNKEAAQKELDEIKILEHYMPEQMSEEQLKKIVQEVITQLSAGPADFGKVMGAVMGKVKGQADGGLVNKIVKELLS